MRGCSSTSNKSRPASPRAPSRPPAAVVVEVRTGGDDPVHEAGFHERDEAALAEARGGERAGERQADEAVAGEHFLREELRGLAQAAAVVGEHRLVDEIGGGDVLADAEGVEARVGGEFFGDNRRVFLAHGARECADARGEGKGKVAPKGWKMDAKHALPQSRDERQVKDWHRCENTAENKNNCAFSCDLGRKHQTHLH